VKRRDVTLLGLLSGLALAAGAYAPARAEVFHAKDEALALAFPEATAVTPRHAFLTEAQVRAVRERAGVDLESRLFSYYVGRRHEDVLGYAVIDTHTVRTLPETFLAVLTPDGKVSQVILLAFYEPKEYMPPARWLDQFTGRRVEGAWRLGRDLHGLSGATLTARAVPQALHKILVLYEVAIRPAGALPP